VDAARGLIPTRGLLLRRRSVFRAGELLVLFRVRRRRVPFAAGSAAPLPRLVDAAVFLLDQLFDLPASRHSGLLDVRA
jgi:hypothetical protein